MLDIIKSIIYGIIQGITEWLPISSTGHLIIAQDFLPFTGAKISGGFFDIFDVVIQMGSIIAVIMLFWNKLWPFQKPNVQENKGFVNDATLKLWLKVIVGIIPAVVAGLFLDKWSETINTKITVSIMLILYGILFIIVERYNKTRHPKITKLSDITYSTALMAGFFQALALIPGTSRSGATILGALMLGFARPIAAEFSFFLAVPTMAGASALKILKFDGGFSSHEVFILAVGTIVSFVVSVFAIRFLMKFLQKKDFTPFAYYRIALGLIVILLL